MLLSFTLHLSRYLLVKKPLFSTISSISELSTRSAAVIYMKKKSCLRPVHLKKLEFTIETQ